MGSIKHRPRPVAPNAARFANRNATLQHLFSIRLQSERVHLVTLSAALAGAEACPGRIFDDLNFRAHRLKGAAATFEYADLAVAAGSLERASFAAANSHAEHSDVNVWAALVTLVQMLGAIETTAATPAAATVVAAE